MENLSLIPGDVGASAVQNIGAYGAEAKDVIERVEAVSITTGEVCTFSGEDCCYGYRDSRFKREWKNQYLITHVTYRLSREYKPRLDYGNIRAELERQGISLPDALQLRQTIIDIRNAKLPDPKVTGNAGSFFMNPVVEREVYDRLAEQYPGMPHYDVDEEHVKIPAGWMIDQCGWKGKSLGKAGVHDRQALVLVNRGGATGQDVIALCQAVCADVEQKFGIALHPEVNIV
jgi:UDP-N-acetylmuramate dehydrogenase